VGGGGIGFFLMAWIVLQDYRAVGFGFCGHCLGGDHPRFLQRSYPRRWCDILIQITSQIASRLLIALMVIAFLYLSIKVTQLTWAS
jgi:hypothetical protein